VDILYCSLGFSPHDHRFLDVLSRSEHQISYWAFSGRNSLDSRNPPERIRDLRSVFSLRMNRGSSLHVARTMAAIISQIKPDLIHAGPLQKIAFPLSLTQFHPLVAMSWGSDVLLDAQSGIGRWKAQYVLRRCDAFICDSHAVLDRADALGVNRENSFIFPWGIDLDQFSPGENGELRTELGWEEATILLTTRNWEPIYGIDLVLEAFAQLTNDLPELRLIMLGDGSMRNDINQAIHRFGLVDKILPVGRVPFADLPVYYQAADVYISSSYSDGSSVSLLEAMATGLVCVVSDISGNREWITHGVDGYLFESGDPMSLVNTLRLCLGERESWPKMGRKAHTQAVERADWTKNYPILFDAYRTAFNNTVGRT